MMVIGSPLGWAHLVDLEHMTSLAQSWRRSVMGNISGTEEIDPLIQGHLAPSVKVIDLKDVVFRVEIAHRFHLELLLLEGGEREELVVVDATELRLTMIDHITSTAKIEVHDVDAVDLPDVLVVLSAVDVFGDQF